MVGWLIAVGGGVAGVGLALVAWWFEEGWSQHFDPGSAYGSDSVRLILAGLGLAAASVAVGIALIRRGSR